MATIIGTAPVPDIDIDFPNRDIILSKLQHRVAKLDSEKKHNTGIYVTEIPHNPIDNLSTIDYKVAENRGYFKLDFLNVSIYKDVKDEAHLQQLMNTEPMWELLEHEEFVDQLFHLNGHTSILKKLKPTNLQQLASVLAIIRPAKRYLIDKDWPTIADEVWKRSEDGSYYFKKAHAIGYAMAVVVHMNLLCEKIRHDYS
jgi:DNA polymerase III alpha subunit